MSFALPEFTRIFGTFLASHAIVLAAETFSPIVLLDRVPEYLSAGIWWLNLWRSALANAASETKSQRRNLFLGSRSKM
jgi:hypothetical protein